MVMRRLLFGTLIYCVAIAGCDKAQPPPEPQASAPTSAPSPTTQLSGESKDIVLANVPLAMSVPKEWELNDVQGVTALEGPLSEGTAQILISRLTPRSADRTNEWLAAATQPSAGTINSEILEVNGLKVWKHVTRSRATTESDAATSGPADVDWIYTVRVPDGDNVLPCAFNLFGMTESDYQSQAAFVDGIIQTIKRDESQNLP